jgi:hypothetical protein
VNIVVTRDLVRMLNPQHLTRDYDGPTPTRRLGGWELTKEYPQPCVKRCSDLGEMWERNQLARQLSSRRPNQSTQMPRFSGTATTAIPTAESPRDPSMKAKTSQEFPTAHSSALKRVMDRQQKGRKPMEPVEKQDQRMTWKGQPVRVSHHQRASNREAEASGSHPRGAHQCSLCNQVGHYASNCSSIIAARGSDPARVITRPVRTPSARQPPIPPPPPPQPPPPPPRPHGPMMGEEGWDNSDNEHSSMHMSDGEKIPSRGHQDALERAGLW